MSALAKTTGHVAAGQWEAQEQSHPRSLPDDAPESSPQEWDQMKFYAELKAKMEAGELSIGLGQKTGAAATANTTNTTNSQQLAEETIVDSDYMDFSFDPSVAAEIEANILHLTQPVNDADVCDEFLNYDMNATSPTTALPEEEEDPDMTDVEDRDTPDTSVTAASESHPKVTDENAGAKSQDQTPTSPLFPPTPVATTPSPAQQPASEDFGLGAAIEAFFEEHDRANSDKDQLSHTPDAPQPFPAAAVDSGEHKQFDEVEQALVSWYGQWTQTEEYAQLSAECGDPVETVTALQIPHAQTAATTLVEATHTETADGAPDDFSCSDSLFGDYEGQDLSVADTSPSTAAPINCGLTLPPIDFESSAAAASSAPANETQQAATPAATAPQQKKRKPFGGIVFDGKPIGGDQTGDVQVTAIKERVQEKRTLSWCLRNGVPFMSDEVIEMQPENTITFIDCTPKQAKTPAKAKAPAKPKKQAKAAKASTTTYPPTPSAAAPIAPSPPTTPQVQNHGPIGATFVVTTGPPPGTAGSGQPKLSHWETSPTAGKKRRASETPAATKAKKAKTTAGNAPSNVSATPRGPLTINLPSLDVLRDMSAPVATPLPRGSTRPTSSRAKTAAPAARAPARNTPARGPAPAPIDLVESDTPYMDYPDAGPMVQVSAAPDGGFELSTAAHAGPNMEGLGSPINFGDSDDQASQQPLPQTQQMPQPQQMQHVQQAHPMHQAQQVQVQQVQPMQQMHQPQPQMRQPQMHQMPQAHATAQVHQLHNVQCLPYTQQVNHLHHMPQMPPAALHPQQAMMNMLAIQYQQMQNSMAQVHQQMQNNMAQVQQQMAILSQSMSMGYGPGYASPMQYELPPSAIPGLSIQDDPNLYHGVGAPQNDAHMG